MAEHPPGILWLPDDLLADEMRDDPDVVQQWLDLITESMLAPIQDQDSASGWCRLG